MKFLDQKSLKSIVFFDDKQENKEKNKKKKNHVLCPHTHA